MTLNDAPYKVEAPTSMDKYHEEQRNRMAFTPNGVIEVPKADPHWNAADVKLLLDTVRLTAPYTPEQLIKIQTFIDLLVEIKTGETK